MHSSEPHNVCIGVVATYVRNRRVCIFSGTLEREEGVRKLKAKNQGGRVVWNSIVSHRNYGADRWESWMRRESQ